ncbi:phospholipase D/nuclease [Rhizodiscina lignyota]|uniref:CDP-diacylglycerol--glycerol-3-phosphate 3-phosphatidyltransferase n=1 Tax=Rhizodiscina lignyota TaxID=1504668 RepID=A0A9P4I5Q8_9PEZI|nr:phospholipase D/nuclease [Rhizodiscina lignyota]
MPLRRFSASSVPSVPPPSSLSIFGGLMTELDKISPRFNIPASQIEILRGPVEFYDTLKSKISNAKRRIYLSTLYIGKAEHELIDTIKEALRKNPELQVSILTDALRGTRETPKPSCASLLASLVEEFGENRVEIRMFHTPNLTGLRKRIVPRRINEGWGLQHMKLYGIDDELILSGANLSNDYFTNRQDRYHVFSSKDITEYFHRIYTGVTSISYSVLPDKDSEAGYTMTWPETNGCPSPLDDPKSYRVQASRVLKPLIEPPSSAPGQIVGDTVVYPLLQFTPLLKPEDTSTELPAILTILRALNPSSNELKSASDSSHTSLATTPPLQNASWTFTAGYFNTPPFLRDLLLSTNPSHGTVIAASPWANGFYGSKGVSGMLPAAYTLLGKHFLNAIQKQGLDDRVKLMEWRRGTVGEPQGWTYHAKGFWVTLAGEDSSELATSFQPEKDVSAEERKGPSLTIVGSSNYTKRSYELDLEANACILTRNPDLMRRLSEEEKWLQEYAKVVDKKEFEMIERRVGLHVRIAMGIVTLLGGAL